MLYFNPETPSHQPGTSLALPSQPLPPTQKPSGFTQARPAFFKAPPPFFPLTAETRRFNVISYLLNPYREKPEMPNENVTIEKVAELMGVELTPPLDGADVHEKKGQIYFYDATKKR